MRNNYFESQIELYKKWMEGTLRLESYNTYANKWYPVPKYEGNITTLLPQVRVKESIKVPREIFVTIYENGRMFAHATEKEAILAVDDGFVNSEYVIKVFESVEPY